MSAWKVMLAHPYAEKRVESWKGMYAEPKLDGVRVIITANLRTDEVNYFSRNGRKLKMFSHLDDEVLGLVDYAYSRYDSRSKSFMLDGEMVSPSGVFNDISGSIHTKDHTETRARYTCFHAMPEDLFVSGRDDKVQALRGDMVREIVEARRFKLIRTVKPKAVQSHDKLMQVYTTHRNLGFEGTMLKNLLVPWVAARTHAWMKLKDEQTADVVVTDVRRGRGKYINTCGALIVDHKGVSVPVSGMTDAQRHQFWKEPKKIVGKMIEVEYQEVTARGSLRHPRFKRLREDKQ